MYVLFPKGAFRAAMKLRGGSRGVSILQFGIGRGAGGGT